MFTVAKAILEVLTVLQELNVIAQRLITVLGAAAVKLAHKSEGSRHTIFQIYAR